MNMKITRLARAHKLGLGGGVQGGERIDGAGAYLAIQGLRHLGTPLRRRTIAPAAAASLDPQARDRQSRVRVADQARIGCACVGPAISQTPVEPVRGSIADKTARCVLVRHTRSLPDG